MSLTVSSYLFYPETARRSLEEIDLIFAKGYVENISYVKAGKELPYLNVEEWEQLAAQYGLTDPAKGKVNGQHSSEKSSHEHLESAGQRGLSPV